MLCQGKMYMAYLSNSHGMKILEPAVAGLGNLKVEHARVDDLLDINLAIA